MKTTKEDFAHSIPLEDIIKQSKKVKKNNFNFVFSFNIVREFKMRNKFGRKKLCTFKNFDNNERRILNTNKYFNRTPV